MLRKRDRSHRRAPLSLVVVALLGLFAACSPSATSTAGTTTTDVPPARSVLRIGVEAWPDCINPLLCATPALREQILQHVLPVAYEVDDDNEYVPSPLLDGEAEVDVTGGEMRIEYRINAAARWADGTPITSSDFLGTWRAVVSTPGADTTGYDLITAVDDADPLVAVVSLDTPYADWPELFGGARNYLLQADAFGPTTNLTEAFADHLPMSAGPYRLLRWGETEAVLARVSDHWAAGREADIDQVRYRRVDLTDAEPGGFDILWPMPANELAVPDGFAERSVPTTRVLGVWFDRRSVVLQEQVHRQAITAALDRAELVDIATTASGVAGQADCLGWVPDAGPWCEAATVARFPRNVEAAEAALGEAQWFRDPESGELARDGQLFELIVHHDPEVPGASAVADELAGELRNLGARVAEEQTATEAWRRTRSEEETTGVGVFVFDLGYLADSGGLYRCAGGVSSSVLAWCDEDVMSDVEDLATRVGLDGRLDLVAAIGEQVYAARSWMPLVQMADRVLVRSARVDAPPSERVTGGPLDNLSSFSVSG